MKKVALHISERASQSQKNNNGHPASNNNGHPVSNNNGIKKIWLSNVLL